MNTIPFEKQLNFGGQRTCGAAALNMIYKSFGIDIPQESVWRVIALPDAQGGRFARTYRLPLDAISRGVHAVAFKATDPIKSVKTILEYGFNVIMNHRLHEKTGDGHYTVALGVNGKWIHFHDPEFGQLQKREITVMRELWQPKFSPCEITGNFLIAISSTPEHHICSTCSSPLNERAKCPACLLHFSLQPVSALGCTNPDCTSKSWEAILCPYCDSAFSRISV